MAKEKFETKLEKALEDTEKRLFAPTERVQSLGADSKQNEDKEESIIEDVTEVDSNATRFDELCEFAAELSLPEFLDIFPDPFLVQNSEHGIDEDSEFFTLQDGVGGAKVPIDLMSATVYRLCKKEDGAFPHMITVGRGRTNDVFISNHRISKFHAYFTIRAGTVYLTDAHSTNGTFYAGKPLDATVATEIAFGGQVSFSETLNFTLVKNSSPENRKGERSFFRAFLFAQIQVPTTGSFHEGLHVLSRILDSASSKNRRP
ncbi:MAG: FHA domain-containing protein [Planctomycetota bacterium]|nr:FHA domain-containing protein [Planctomycetota bacterium]